jgi:hypothetical protein
MGAQLLLERGSNSIPLSSLFRSLHIKISKVTPVLTKSAFVSLAKFWQPFSGSLLSSLDDDASHGGTLSIHKLSLISTSNTSERENPHQEKKVSKSPGQGIC